jgi:hypothetical protein
VKRKTEGAVQMTARIMVSLWEGTLLMDGQQVLTLEEMILASSLISLKI